VSRGVWGQGEVVEVWMEAGREESEES